MIYRAAFATVAIAPVVSVLLFGSIKLAQVEAPLAFKVATVKRSNPASDATWEACRGTDAPARGGPWVSGRILQGMKPPALRGWAGV